MTEQDIVGQMAVIIGSFDKIKEVEQSFAHRAPTQGEVTTMDEAKERALLAALQLGTNLLVNINDIAESLKFVASQHNNSEALFRG